MQQKTTNYIGLGAGLAVVLVVVFFPDYWASPWRPIRDSWVFDFWKDLLFDLGRGPRDRRQEALLLWLLTAGVFVVPVWRFRRWIGEHVIRLATAFNQRV